MRPLPVLQKPSRMLRSPTLSFDPLVWMQTLMYFGSGFGFVRADPAAAAPAPRASAVVRTTNTRRLRRAAARDRTVPHLHCSGSP